MLIFVLKALLIFLMTFLLLHLLACWLESLGVEPSKNFLFGPGRIDDFDD